MWSGFVIRFWNWFDNSGTILWGRLQVLVGAIWTVAVTTDLMSSWLSPKYFPVWVVFSGVVTEYMRRSNAVTNTIVVRDDNGIQSNVKYLSPKSPVPKGMRVVVGLKQKE